MNDLTGIIAASSACPSVIAWLVYGSIASFWIWDTTGAIQNLIEPGANGIYTGGTGDDIKVPLTNYKRKIEIFKVADTDGTEIAALHEIVVTLQYTTPRSSIAKTYVLTSYISQYR